MVYRLVNEVDERWFDIHAIDEDGKPLGQVQIMGWMYQYYNTEPKDKVFADLKKNIKISKQNIPAATQLFTPDWIVRYMVENSLGRLWVEGHPDFDKSDWKYYLDEAPQEPQVEQRLQEIRAQYAKMEPEQLKVIDPCMGSGHILCYLFDVLMQIYLDNGYSKREAVRSILENNLFGLDIDKRAAQFAYFSVMMKAREYDSGFFGRKNIPQPRVYDIQESNWMGGAYKHEMGSFLNSQEHRDTLNYLLDTFIDAKEYGSILQIKPLDYEGLKEAWDTSAAATASNVNMAMWYDAVKDSVEQLIEQAIMLSQKYDAVVTNPPYMGASNMNPRLNEFIKQNYADYKSDFFSAFIVRAAQMTKLDGRCGFFTPYVWMFIQSYEKLRQYLYSQATLETLIQFEYSAFEEATVPVCTFTFAKRHVNKKGNYLRLVDFRGGMEVQRQKMLEAIADHNCGFYYEQSTDNFTKIPGCPVAYWATDKCIEAFVNGQILSCVAQIKQGIKTGDNDKFVRLWYEVSVLQTTLCEGKKWYPYNKGGDYRRWFGNNVNVVDWENDGESIKNFRKEDGKLRSRPQNLSFMGREGLTYTDISSTYFGIRWSPSGFIFDATGSMIFSNESRKQNYLLGMLSSKVTTLYTSFFSPTIHFEVGEISRIPIVYSEINLKRVDKITKDNIELSRGDWDAFETSWDFKRHPLV